LEFSRDGKFVACVGSGLGLWEVETGREILGVTGHIGPVASAAVSNDGRWIVTGGTEGTVRVWNAASGKHQLAYVHGARLSSVAFSPGGEIIASAAADGTVRLWSIATGAEVRRLEFPGADLGDVAFSPDGKLLGVGGRNLTVHLFDVSTGKRKGELVGYDGFSQNGGSTLRFLPDGKHIAALIRRGAGCVGDPLRDSYKPPVGISPFDPSLGPAGETDGMWRVALWDIVSGKRVKLLGPAGEDGVWFDISRDGERLAMSNYTGNPVSVVAIKSGDVERQFEAKKGYCLHFTATGDLFVGSICYDLDAGGEVKQLAAISDDRLPLAVFPDGHKVVAWGHEAPIVWTVFGR
jgi:WD40 repeat protein